MTSFRVCSLWDHSEPLIKDLENQQVQKLFEYSFVEIKLSLKNVKLGLSAHTVGHIVHHVGKHRWTPSNFLGYFSSEQTAAAELEHVDKTPAQRPDNIYLPA